MLEVKVERCAGIDVHKKFLAVCVMIGLANQKPSSEVRRFGTTERVAWASAEEISAGPRNSGPPSSSVPPASRVESSGHRDTFRLDRNWRWRETQWWYAPVPPHAPRRCSLSLSRKVRKLERHLDCEDRSVLLGLFF